MELTFKFPGARYEKGRFDSLEEVITVHPSHSHYPNISVPSSGALPTLDYTHPHAAAALPSLSALQIILVENSLEAQDEAIIIGDR